MSLQLSGNGVVTGLDSVGSSDLGSLLGSKLDLAGGKILQIVRATDTTQRTTTSATLVDANLSVTITPTKNTSAIILIYTATYGVAGSGTTPNASIAITDSGDNTISGAQNGNLFHSTSGSNIIIPAVLIAYATPATINATTYKARFNGGSNRTATLYNNVQTGQLLAIEVSA
jgi:hypothetical protein